MQKRLVVPVLSLAMAATGCATAADAEDASAHAEALTFIVTDRVPTAPGAYPLRFGWDGDQRSYLLYLPPGYDQNRAASYPLLAMFHGGGQSATSFAGRPGMQDLQTVVDTKGYVVVFVNAATGSSAATRGAWEWDSSVRDDFGYTAALLDRLSADLNVDTSRIFAGGFSRGGAFVHHLGIHDGARYRGIAAVEGFYAKIPDVPYISPATSPTLPVFMVHQDGDPTVPYGGGSGYTSANEAYTNWYANNHCTAWSMISTGSLVDTKSTSCLMSSIPLKLVTFHGSEHEWPPATTGYNTSASMIAFFDSL